MPGWVQTILNVLLFIIALSFLILVHEAGHLSAAKIFKVYCEDFSIGFGKAFFSKKRKGGETSFSLRILPFGGYVAMAGEEGEIKEGLNIPKERTIAGVAKWKAAIIMSAGIIVNIIVSILLLYVSNQFFYTEGLYNNAFKVKEDSIAEKAGIINLEENDEGRVTAGNFVVSGGDPRKGMQALSYYSYDSLIHFEDGTTKAALGALDATNMTLKNSTFDNNIRFFERTEAIKKVNKNLSYKFVVGNPEAEFKASTRRAPLVVPTADEAADAVTYGITSVDFNLNAYSFVTDPDIAKGSYYCTGCGKNIDASEVLVEHNKDTVEYFHKNCPCHRMEKIEEGKPAQKISLVLKGYKSDGQKTLNLKVIEDDKGNKTFEKTGISLAKYGYWQNFGQAWTNTFRQFGNGAGLIFTTLGRLFVGDGWDQMGSVIAMFNQQSKIMSGFNGQTLIYYWGLISVNLAIFNLLPFPGLDGWQLLVIAVEGITRKKIPEKVKTIMSYVGLALLFGLMIFLLIKDVIGLF